MSTDQRDTLVKQSTAGCCHLANSTGTAQAQIGADGTTFYYGFVIVSLRQEPSSLASDWRQKSSSLGNGMIAFNDEVCAR